MSATTGTWSNSPTGYAYQWRRCDSSGGACADIGSATAANYTLVVADVGSTVRVTVTASNAGGSASASSSQTAVVSAAPVPPPANTLLPAVSGSAQEGQTLSATTGTWSNSPTGYAYQWRRCDSSGGACADIGSATAANYTLVVADVGSTVRVTVTASNAGGSASASSSQTAVVSAAPVPPPANTLLPAVWRCRRVRR